MTAPRVARTGGLAVKLAFAFAGVALATALAVAIAAPPIVGRGFAAMQAAGASGTPGGGLGPGHGAGMGPGAGAGMGTGQGAYAAQLQQETTTTIILVAIAAAGIASILGVFVARRVAKPLERLEATAAAVAQGDLSVRSGLSGRGDEIGSLGRSFDAMAADLERGEASRRRFFQDAAHEMKTPLAVIDATAAAVMDGVYEHDDRHLATIREQARVLGRVVDDLRTISLADAGALPLDLAQVRLDEVIGSVAEAFAARAGARGISIASEPAPLPAITVTADRDRLAQAIATMVDNAVRFAPDGGHVTLAWRGAGGTARVEVGDDGPGVAPEDMPRVFDRLYQADPGRDRASGTSGLGLAIARAIVETHGGRVGVEGRPGGGARFWLEIPVTRQADAG
ncbi:MAG TPA: HAMP domain-containing sensor histidine kinase [Candidatus Limnocylindrales bacterium]|nr:HAMP domain-containing sensor histidine kinase [Candidatus Limnocylindrales bacterium]